MTVEKNLSKADVPASWRVLVLLSLTVALYFFANFQRTVVPGTIFSELQQDFDATAASITALGSTFMYVYAVSQLFAGLLADKFGGFRVIIAGGALFCGGSLLFPFAGNMALLYICRILVGIGSSTIYLSMVKEFSRAFPNNFAPALGVALLVGYAGSIAATAPFVALMQFVDWRNALLDCAVGMTVLWALLLVLRCLVKRSLPSSSVKFSVKAFIPVLRRRHNWMLYILTGCSFAVFYDLQTVVGKKFLEDYCGMTVQAAGWILAVTGGLSAAANFSTPIISKFCGNRRRPFMLLMGGGTFLSSLGILTTMLYGSRNAVCICGLLFLLALCTNMTPVILALFSETNSPDHLCLCASFSNCLAYLLVAVLGSVTGILMDCFVPKVVDGIRVYPVNSYLAVFGLLAFFGLLAALAAVFTRESYGRPLEVK